MSAGRGMLWPTNPHQTPPTCVAIVCKHFTIVLPLSIHPLSRTPNPSIVFSSNMLSPQRPKSVFCSYIARKSLSLPFSNMQSLRLSHGFACVYSHMRCEKHCAEKHNCILHLSSSMMCQLVSYGVSQHDVMQALRGMHPAGSWWT